MKNLRKILCYVLSVLMLSGMLLTAPATANAAETNIQEVGATYSGTTGSCTWILNTSTGVLSITGTGAMGNYSWSSDVPWDSYSSYVKTVNIANGVTSIGNKAFYWCTSLTSVTIPSSVTSIGSNAFYYCTRLTSVTISSSVTSIGSNAFQECTSLTSVTIPSSVTSIGSYAFDRCTSLTSVTIPSSVTSIGNYAFRNCTSLTSISVNSNNTKYSSINGNLYNKDKTTLIQYAIGKTATSFTIPSSVTSIGSDAFRNCTSLTSVTIPSSITSIGSYAFYSCTSLTSVTIPSSVTSIGSYAFRYCTSLTSISVNSNNTKYSSINGNLYNKDKTTLIQYAIGKTATSFTIPSSVTSIGSYAFYYCTSLTSVTIPSSVTSIGSDAFNSCTSLTSVIIPSSVTSIGSWAFYWCTSLTSVTIPSSVTSIGSYAFYSCTSLTSVTIPSSVTSIGDYAFYYCTSLKNVYYTGTASDWNNISIGSNNTPLTSATIYYSVEETEASETESTESSYETISLNVSKTVNISTAGDVKYYQFTPSKSGTYQIYSSGDYDTYGYLYDSNMNELTRDDEGGSGNNFKISYSLTAGTKYIIGAKFWSSSNTGSFTVTVTDGTGSATEATEPTTESTESSYETISLNVSKTVNISTAGDVKYYQFTPTTSGTYQIYSSGDYDTYGYLYDSNMNQLTYDDDEGSGRNFKISYDLIAGRKYIIGAKLYDSSRTGSFTITVTDGTGSSTEATDPTTEPTEPTEALDLIKPTVNIRSTNNLASSQTVTLTLSDNVGIAGYYWGTNPSYYNNTFSSTSSTSITKTISSVGTYYLTAKDTSGNVSTTKSITFYRTTLNANGGTLQSDMLQFILTKSGNSFTPPTPAKTGFTFVGWSTSSTATTGSTSITPTSNATYYAVWSCETISLNETKTVNISTAGNVKYYQFTPTTSGTYEIYTSGSYDTYGYLYDSNMSELDYDDDGGSEYNFKISYSLTAGTKYIIGAEFISSDDTGSFNLTVAKKPETAVCTHNSTWTRDKKTATYFEKGYTGDKICNNCGKVVSKGRSVAKKVLATPKTTIKSRGNAIVISYTKVKGAHGFEMECKFGSKKYSQKIKTTKSKTITLSNIKRGINAKIKVRAFITSGKRKAYSDWTKTKTLKIK